MKSLVMFATVFVSGLTSAVVAHAASRTSTPVKAKAQQASAVELVEPKTLECTYEAFNTRTGQALPGQSPVRMDLDQEAGATKMLTIGKFGTMDATAWEHGGKITVIAQKADGVVTTSGDRTANLHLEVAGATYETVCSLK